MYESALEHKTAATQRQQLSNKIFIWQAFCSAYLFSSPIENFYILRIQRCDICNFIGSAITYSSISKCFSFGNKKQARKSSNFCACFLSLTLSPDCGSGERLLRSTLFYPIDIVSSLPRRYSMYCSVRRIISMASYFRTVSRMVFLSCSVVFSMTNHRSYTSESMLKILWRYV